MKNYALFDYLTVLLSVIVFCSCDGDDLSEKVDISDIPSYYYENNYLDNRIKVINEAIEECADGCESFFWITDIHWEPEFNARKSPLLIKYIASKTGIDKILNGGDTGNSQVICKNAIAQLRNAIGSNRVYTVTGNHEMYDASGYEKPFERVADELRSHNTDIVYGDNNKSYFYFDNVESKVRYIGLSAYGLLVNDDHESCYTAEQLTWFKNTALNVEKDWAIVIFSHTLYHVNCVLDKLSTSPEGAKDFIDAIDNYNGEGTISCVLLGHTHRDRIHIGRTGIPYIITASDRLAPYLDDINVERIPGTISEQHFEVVVIDKSKRKIKLFSIGANARDGYDDNSGKEVDVRVVSY